MWPCLTITACALVAYFAVEAVLYYTVGNGKKLAKAAE